MGPRELVAVKNKRRTRRLSNTEKPSERPACIARDAGSEQQRFPGAVNLSIWSDRVRGNRVNVAE